MQRNACSALILISALLGVSSLSHASEQNMVVVNSPAADANATQSPFNNPFFNSSQKWGPQSGNAMPPASNSSAPSPGDANVQVPEINIPPEAITQVEAKSAPDGTPSQSSASQDLAPDATPQSQDRVPAGQPQAPQVNQVNPAPASQAPVIAVPNIDNGPQSVVSPSEQVTTTPLGGAKPDVPATNAPSAAVTVQQPAADSSANINNIIEMRGKGQVDAATPSVSPQTSAGVTNLSPNAVAAPPQTLPKAAGIEGAISKLREKIDQVEGKEQKIQDNPKDVNDVQPVVIDESSYKAKAPEIDEALSLIFKEDSKIDRRSKLEKTTRKVYDYSPTKPVTKKSQPTSPITPLQLEHLTSNLFLAISSGNVGAVQSLLERGADINGRTVAHGLTPLMVAIGNNDSRLVRYLLVKGADVNVTSEGNTTALKLAAINGNIEIIQLLVDFHADFMIRDDDGKFAFDYLDGAKRDLAVMTIAKSCKELDRCLIESTLFGSPAAVSLMIKRGADVNALDAQGYTPLMLASRIGYFDVINLLLDGGADPRIATPSGKRATDFAAQRGDKSSVLVLETVSTRMELEGMPLPGASKPIKTKHHKVTAKHKK